jgi:hypothetical protein
LTIAIPTYYFDDKAVLIINEGPALAPYLFLKQPQNGLGCEDEAHLTETHKRYYVAIILGWLLL